MYGYIGMSVRAIRVSIIGITYVLTLPVPCERNWASIS